MGHCVPVRGGGGGVAAFGAHPAFATHLEPEEASPEEKEQRRPSVALLCLGQQLVADAYPGRHGATVQREQRTYHRVVPQQSQTDRGRGGAGSGTIQRQPHRPSNESSGRTTEWYHSRARLTTGGAGRGGAGGVRRHTERGNRGGERDRTTTQVCTTYQTGE